MRITTSQAKQLLLVAAIAASSVAYADGVRQLTFGGYNREHGVCELSELGAIHDPSAKTYAGVIEGKGDSGRSALCNVSIPREQFDRRYRYCALASVENIRAMGYVCEVFHFEHSVVFSYAHSGPPQELPMCSFVCPTP